VAGAALCLAVLGAGPGTAEDSSLLDRWGLKPVYSSTYDVRRQETAWWQKLGLQRSGGIADLDAGLEVKAREDKSRNDYQDSDNRFSLQVARQSWLGQLSVDGGVRRRWNQDRRSLTVMDEDRMSLGDRVALLEREAAALSLSFGGGWVRGREVKERQAGTLSTTDRTRSAGWEGESRLEGQLQPWTDLKLTGQASWEGSLQDSRSQHLEEDQDTSYVAKDHARTLQCGSTVEWTRLKAAQLALEANLTDGFAQYYQATSQAQETKFRRLRTLELRLEGEPLDSLAYAVDVTTDLRSFDYRVERNDKLDSSRQSRFSTEYRPSFFLLAGGRVRGAVQLGTRRTVNENTADYDTREKSVEGEISRPLGPRFTAQLRGTASLTQDFYDDRSLDKDRLRNDTLVSLRYDRGQAFLANASYAASRTEDINIPRARAVQNQVQDDFRVTLDYQAALPARVELRQNFQISATYAYYVYNEGKNTLNRANRVTTKLKVPLWSTSSLYLEHIYNRADNGVYSYPAGGGQRTYRVGQENLRQYLSAVADYQLSDMIQIKATQSLNVESRRSLDGTPSTRREKLTFSGLVGLRRRVRGIDLDASFERTSSNTEEDYWTVNARLEKRFN
jgi:hypothetical protein